MNHQFTIDDDKYDHLKKGMDEKQERKAEMTFYLHSEVISDLKIY